MELITLLYILNASLLILHEIESAYEREWEILKLPGKITGFLLLHVPILLVLFYGVLEIQKQTLIGLVLGIIAGIGGVIPFLVHKVFLNRKDKFNLPISNVLIYSNIITGVITAALSISYIIK
jgi:predicted membrane protein